MPKIILDNVPPEVYEHLQQLAAAKQQTVAEEVLQQLTMWLPDPPFLSEEIPAPYDLPLPGEKVAVEAQTVPMWLPDPPLLPQDPS